MDGLGMVTVSCASHHDVLVNGLWSLLATNHGPLDFDFRWGGLSIRAHRLMLEVFLSPENLWRTAVERSEDRGSNSSIFSCLVEFLYKGTVNVPTGQLDKLLEVAK